MANDKTRIVILGGGFGGAYCAQKLDRLTRHREDVEVWLIDQRNFFIFTPLLIEAGTGGVEPRHAVVSIRNFTGRAHFRMATVTGIDLDEQSVKYRLCGVDLCADEADGERTLDYDHLVLALGSVTMLPPVEGLKEHAFEMKSLGDAVAMRDRVIQLLELADATESVERRRALLTFVVVGASYTGVELAGEFDAFLNKAVKRYPNLSRDDYQFHLIEMKDRILPALDEELADFATENLRSRGVDVRTGSTAESIHADHVVLEGGERIDAYTTIWTAGVAPNPLIDQTGLPKKNGGYIACQPDLRVDGFANLWAIGDCAVNPDPDGQAYPPTAQHATRMGEHLAKNLLRVVDGAQPDDFAYDAVGYLAALGCRQGVARVMGVKISGFLAWWLWRTVYLMKMPGLGRKLRVAFDWTLDLFHKKDIVQLSVHRSGG